MQAFSSFRQASHNPHPPHETEAKTSRNKVELIGNVDLQYRINGELNIQFPIISKS